MNNKNSLPKYASKLMGKLAQQFISPNINNMSIDSTKDPKKEMEELKNTFVQYDKYIRSIIDEKKHFQKGDRGANYLNQASKMSSQQKSQIIKTEEKMIKITLQQFINFDEKNKNNKNQGPTLLLNDNENIGLSIDDKVNELLKILEHHNECVMERPYCKNLQEIIILELFLNFSQIGCSLNLLSNEKSEKIKKIKNYLKQLAGNVQYDLFSSPNYTLNYISQKLIDIPEIYNGTNKSKKLNLQSFFFPEESDSENSIPDYGEEEEESSEKSDGSCSEEVLAEEINEEYSHKLIFFDEKKKNIVNISKGANEFTINPNESYIERKNYLMGLRENAYDNIIEIIKTESILLPKYKHTMNYEELIEQVKEINEKKKKEKETVIKDNYIKFNSEDEDEYEDDNCSQLISQIHTYSNQYIKSFNKSLDHVSIYKKNNFLTSMNLVNVFSKNRAFKKIKEEFSAILNIFPYLHQRQNSDLSTKKLHILKQKRNDEFFNSYFDNTVI